ncbi:ABC transporter permease [Gloeobacter violaceus]|uniref:Glr3473 protein n=1 Tax=Gloeobacter violaceus (strain ATCC 29082 / PCC 7421) TaxID=251221 RepID=Q7NFQ1_GLOVI|nr:ABC transporter permease [Gloeobacter violaceus]BAC91414.1 glr3473 [Gloeobacter violaceus PCC 7421]
MNTLRQIWALTWKDLRLLAGDRTAIVTLFILPALFLLVMSQALAGLYNRSQLPRVITLNADRGVVAAKILGRLSGSVRLEAAADRPAAEARLRSREAAAAVIFGEDFSRLVEGGGQPSVGFIVDPAAPRELLAPIQGAIRGAAERTLAEVVLPIRLRERVDDLAAQSPDPLVFLPLAGAFDNLQVGEVAIKEEYPSGSAPPAQRPSSLQQNVPAWTIFGIFFIVNALALSILRERQSGTLTRLAAAPLRIPVLLAGKLLPFYLINLVQAALMFALGIFGLGLVVGAQWPALILVTLAVAAVATSLGLLIATLFETPEQLGGIASVLVVVLAALGGILVPGFVMPELMRKLAALTPQYWALEGYQNVLLRNEGVVGVLPQVGVLLLFAIGLFLLATWRLGRAPV